MLSKLVFGEFQLWLKTQWLLKCPCYSLKFIQSICSGVEAYWTELDAVVYQQTHRSDSKWSFVRTFLRHTPAFCYTSCEATEKELPQWGHQQELNPNQLNTKHPLYPWCYVQLLFPSISTLSKRWNDLFLLWWTDFTGVSNSGKVIFHWQINI